ncbi:hypothetical protein AC578_4104 [Pseudocercospora eumusae]|uniref:Uncharacterized protein n=1 Tax=Pseudocercospora eumusae TaxID=321146 RepID=A0A139HF71_9PEZI|nr:hypothetical protein AC578_4104 [Pseudocercospora eumusae]
MPPPTHIDYLEMELQKANDLIAAYKAQQSKDHAQMRKHISKLDSNEGYIEKLEKELQEACREKDVLQSRKARHDSESRRGSFEESLRVKIEGLEKKCKKLELSNEKLQRKCEELDRMEAIARQIHGMG